MKVDVSYSCCITLPKTNINPKNYGFQSEFPFPGFHFQGYVSFRECTYQNMVGISFPSYCSFYPKKSDQCVKELLHQSENRWRNSQKVAWCGAVINQHIGVASHLLSRWYIFFCCSKTQNWIPKFLGQGFGCVPLRQKLQIANWPCQGPSSPLYWTVVIPPLNYTTI